MRKTLILNRSEIEHLVTMKESIRVVEKAFASLGRGEVQMPAKIYLHLDKLNGDFRAMPAYIERLERSSLKWVNVHPLNRRFGLPAVMAVLILSDPNTGYPLSVMDATYITNLRTGAAGGVAAKYLARKDSQRLALVGSGAQAEAQLSAITELFDIKDVSVWANTRESSKEFVKNTKLRIARLRIASSVKECVTDSDIVVTTTPSRKPLVKLEWLKKGVHINAIGADARGKEELEPAILKRAKVVVDSWEQASHSGEINVPVSKGIISKKDIYGDIGEIACGRKRGRKDSSEITVFDSTGLAIQDLAVADIVYRKALRRRIGIPIRLV